MNYCHCHWAWSFLLLFALNVVDISIHATRIQIQYHWFSDKQNRNKKINQNLPRKIFGVQLGVSEQFPKFSSFFYNDNTMDHHQQPNVVNSLWNRYSLKMNQVLIIIRRNDIEIKDLYLDTVRYAD